MLGAKIVTNVHCSTYRVYCTDYSANGFKKFQCASCARERRESESARETLVYNKSCLLSYHNTTLGSACLISNAESGIACGEHLEYVGYLFPHLHEECHHPKEQNKCDHC